MNKVECEGTQPVGIPGVDVVGSVVHTPGLLGPWSCERTGKVAAATAAGFCAVWSATRLLMRRGWVSKTSPFFCGYDVGSVPPALPTPNSPAGFFSARRKSGSVNRGYGWSADANWGRLNPGVAGSPSTAVCGTR